MTHQKIITTVATSSTDKSQNSIVFKRIPVAIRSNLGANLLGSATLMINNSLYSLTIMD